MIVLTKKLIVLLIITVTVKRNSYLWTWIIGANYIV